MQASFGSWGAQASSFDFDGQLGSRNAGGLANSVGQDTQFAISAVGSSFGVFNSMDESSRLMNPMNHDSAVGGTGIKIRARQPQVRPCTDGFAIQGTAPRRLRLQKEFSAVPHGNRLEKDKNHNEDEDEEEDEDEDEEEDEVQSAVAEVSVLK